MDLLVRAGRYGLDGMPQFCPSGKWSHGDNDSASRGDIEKPLPRSGIVEDSQTSRKFPLAMTWTTLWGSQ